jgi:hypothetical protein
MRNSLVVTVGALILFAGVSRADLLIGCSTCQGSTYLLQYNPRPVGTYTKVENHGKNSTTVAGTIYDVFLTVDTSAYTGGGLYINNVAIKIANSVDLPPSQLINAPGGANLWTVTAGGLNANGCQTDTDSGALCTQDGKNAPVSGGPWTWEFHYGTTDSLFTAPLGSDIKVRYVDELGKKVGALVSEDITLQPCGGTTGEDCGPRQNDVGEVPEPFSVVLLGTVLAGTVATMRHKFKPA